MSDILCGVRPLQMGSESLFGLARPEVRLRKEAERVTVNQLTAGFPQRAHRVSHPDYPDIEIGFADEHSSDDHRSHRGPVRKALLTGDLLQRFGTQPDVSIVAKKVAKSIVYISVKAMLNGLPSRVARSRASAARLNRALVHLPIERHALHAAEAAGLHLGFGSYFLR
jgi:hypothetical protein